ncbi:MAG: HAMP domain-containing protein [Pseudorhodoplanes sp.]|nr:HAMP domain-containing protein [Pseudorhodoplanes sp.]
MSNVDAATIDAGFCRGRGRWRRAKPDDAVQLEASRREISFVATKPIAGVDNARAAWSAYRDVQAYLANFLELTRPQESKEAIAAFESQIKALETHLARLGEAVTSAEPGEKLQALKADVANWREKALVLLGASPAISVPASFALARIEVAIRNNLDGLVTLALQDAGAMRADVEASISRAMDLSLLFIALGVLAGAALALVSALMITRLLLRLEGAMRRLAAGDLAVEVTDGGRKDEIGRMASALDVFRANAVEMRRLRNAGPREREDHGRRAAPADGRRRLAVQEPGRRHRRARVRHRVDRGAVRRAHALARQRNQQARRSRRRRIRQRHRQHRLGRRCRRGNGRDLR